MKKLITIIIVITGFAFAGNAQQTPISNNPELKKMVLKALDEIYNFHFDDAVKECELIKKKLPGHPIYHMLMAMNLDWQWEPTLDDNVKLAQIISHLNQSVTLSDFILNKQKKDDAEVMFIHFTALGFMARVHSFLNDYLKSVQYSKNAYDYVKKGFKLKDKFGDFYFSTGMYNYYREKYPELHPMVKPLAGLLESGNAELGIKQLRFTYQHSLFSKIEAANYLVNIYFKYEGKPQEVMPVLEEVVKTYPDNLFFVSKYTEGLLWTGKTDHVQIYINKLIKSGLPYYMMCGYTYQARLLIKQNKMDDALKDCKIAETHYKKCPKIKDNLPAYLYQAYAQIYAAKGNKTEAVRYYKLVANKAEYPTTIAEAQKWLASRK